LQFFEKKSEKSKRNPKHIPKNTKWWNLKVLKMTYALA
jgi:hypothetical protein